MGVAEVCRGEVVRRLGVSVSRCRADTLLFQPVFFFLHNRGLLLLPFHCHRLLSMPCD